MTARAAVFWRQGESTRSEPKTDWDKFQGAIKKKYGTCEKCGAWMEHRREIHTFVCPNRSCKNRVWYPERIGKNKWDDEL